MKALLRLPVVFALLLSPTMVGCGSSHLSEEAAIEAEGEPEAAVDEGAEEEVEVSEDGERTTPC